MNHEYDIEVLFLELSTPALFPSMQPAAESKDKGYRCIVYSKRRLTREVLVELEQSASPKLQLRQKTPLRVLHRRPLLDRTRFVYQLKAVYINEHYFILSLNTSAGTYVKEFVHGDLGRTVPSVSSMLGTHADILQLDVTWLFDEFRGGGGMVDGYSESLKCYMVENGIDLTHSQINDHDSDTSAVAELNDMKLIPLRSKESMIGTKRKTVTPAIDNDVD